MSDNLNDTSLSEPEENETPFQKGLKWLRANKEAIYKRMEEQANNPETQAYYANPENRFDDVDVEVFDD